VSRIGSAGPLDAKICIIGEAWGVNEDRLKLPFQGQAGQMLSQLLATGSINRDDCYITNVINERPPNNDIKKFIDIPSDKRKSITVTEAYHPHEEALYKEIAEINPNVIVLAGATALYAATRLRGITNFRGSILVGERGPFKGKKLIPIVHPSSLLRDFLARIPCINDMMRIKEQTEFPGFNYIKRNYVIRPSYEMTMDYLGECLKSNTVGWDIEVFKHNREISCISFSPNKHTAISVPFFAKNMDYYSIHQEKEVWLRIAKILEDPNIQKLAHNAAFDAGFVYERMGIIPKSQDCTMVAHGITMPDLPKTLDFLTSLYTDLPYYKEEGKARIRTGIGTDESFWLYNAKDSITLHEIWDETWADIVSMGNEATYRRQIATLEPCMYMTSKGFRVDKAGIESESANLAEKVKVLLEQIKEETNGAITLSRSTKQIRQYFYFDLGLNPIMYGGIMKTDEKALKKLAGRGQPIAYKILRCRQHENRKSKYLDVNYSLDGRLRGTYNVIGTKHGRFSTHQSIFAEGINIQTPPSEVRIYMLVDEGYYFVNIDLNQAENRIVAYISPDMNMIHAFEHGVDIHAQTGALISGLPIDEVIKQYKEDIFSSLGDGIHTWRFWGKKCNHAFNYGEGPIRFATDAEISVTDAKFLRNRYHSIYPGVGMFHSWIENRLRRFGATLKNPYGRVRTFKGRLDDAMVREGANFMAQSTVADKINKEGMSFIWDNPKIFDAFEIINQMHDSLLLQVPLDTSRYKIAEALLMLKESLSTKIMYKNVAFSIPIGMEVGLNFKGHGKSNPTGLLKVDLMGSQNASSLEFKLNMALLKVNNAQLRAANV